MRYKRKSLYPPKSDWEYGESNNDYWLFSQITTNKGFSEEGKKMHHCVYSYLSPMQDRKKLYF